MALLLKTDCAVKETSLPKPTTNTTDLVCIYLRQIGSVPLLTDFQEIVYGKQMQQMMFLLEAKDALGRRLRREPTVMEWASQGKLSFAELTRCCVRGGRRLTRWSRLTCVWSWRSRSQYQNRGMEFLDLIQSGSMDLARGVEKFDPTRGYKLKVVQPPVCGYICSEAFLAYWGC